MVGCEAKAIGEYCENLISRRVISHHCSMTVGQNSVGSPRKERSTPTLSFWEFENLYRLVSLSRSIKSSVFSDRAFWVLAPESIDCLFARF